MQVVTRRKRHRWRLPPLVVFAALALWPLPVAAESALAPDQRLANMQTATNLLSEEILVLRQTLPATGTNGATAAPPVLHVAQSARDQASINLRLSQLEEQLRTLTGQVEGLQFQMTQMQTLIQRMADDNEFRFQQLEGGKPVKKTDAAPTSDGVTPSAGLPQTQTLDNPETAIPAEDQPTDLTAPEIDNPPAPGDGLTLGAPAQPLGTLDQNDVNLTGQPLDLTAGGGAVVRDGDADAQYKAGYDAVIRGDYQFAEEQFRQFIALFPKNEKAADATNWLGEALILRGSYDEAADVLLKGFQAYQGSPRAPDLLFKLGIALSGAGETATACRTFDEVRRRFPKQPEAFMTRLDEEATRATCPAPLQ